MAHKGLAKSSVALFQAGLEALENPIAFEGKRNFQYPKAIRFFLLHKSHRHKPYRLGTLQTYRCFQPGVEALEMPSTGNGPDAIKLLYKVSGLSLLNIVSPKVTKPLAHAVTESYFLPL